VFALSETLISGWPSPDQRVCMLHCFVKIYPLLWIVTIVFLVHKMCVWAWEGSYCCKTIVSVKYPGPQCFLDKLWWTFKSLYVQLYTSPNLWCDMPSS